MELTREYYKAVRDCKPGDCGDCILKPQTNRACHMVDVDPRDEARLVLSLMDERDRYRALVAELEMEIERERIRLAACGVAAGQNTEETRKERIIPENSYFSASYADVCAAVDREMSLRTERDALKAENARLREFAERARDWRAECHDYDADMGYELRDFVDAEEWDRLEGDAAAALSVQP